MKRSCLAAAVLLAAASAWAQYKVVGPDGRITYTDRPPASAAAKVAPVTPEEGTASASPLAALPYELRQVATRFPVTLYAAPDCAPCDKGRQLLQRRGIPYRERRVQTEDDLVALERLTGARTVPVLAVGAQLSRGWQESEWQTTLDLAGYPAQSRLPPDWVAAAPKPLAPARVAPPAAPTPAPAPAAPAPPPSNAAPGFRF